MTVFVRRLTPEHVCMSMTSAQTTRQAECSLRRAPTVITDKFIKSKCIATLADDIRKIAHALYAARSAGRLRGTASSSSVDMGDSNPITVSPALQVDVSSAPIVETFEGLYVTKRGKQAYNYQSIEDPGGTKIGPMFVSVAGSPLYGFMRGTSARLPGLTPMVQCKWEHSL